MKKSISRILGASLMLFGLLGLLAACEEDGKDCPYTLACDDRTLVMRYACDNGDTWDQALEVCGETSECRGCLANDSACTSGVMADARSVFAAEDAVDAANTDDDDATDDTTISDGDDATEETSDDAESDPPESGILYYDCYPAYISVK